MYFINDYLSYVFSRQKLVMIGCCLLIWLICGYFARPVPLLPERFAGQKLNVQGQVVGLPKVKKQSVQFDFAPKNQPLLPKLLRLSWYYGPMIEPGMTFNLTVALKKPRNYANQGSFDYVSYLRRQGVGAVGYVRKGKQGVSVASWMSLDKIRWYVQGHLKKRLPKATVGWASALLLGDTSLLNAAQWQLLKDTGTVHLFIVSGLHIALAAALGGFVGWLVFFLLFPFKWASGPLLKASFALFFAIIYALLSGMGIAAQRALLMLILWLFCYVSGVYLRPKKILFFTFFLLTAFSPLWWTSAGFWLSFTAVAALLARFSGRVVFSKNAFFKLVIAQWTVFWALLPILLFLGNPISWLTPLINLILIPLIGCFVLPVLAITLLISFFTGSQFLWHWCHEFFNLMQLTLGYFANLHLGFNAQGPTIVAAFVGLIGSFMLLVPSRLLWLPALCCLLPTLFPVHTRLVEGAVKVTFFDVGQGLSVLVSTRSHNLLFDTGAGYEDFLLARVVVLPYLQKQGISTLDGLIISHNDNDHAAGKDFIEQRFHPKLDLVSYGRNNCHRYNPWFWDGVSFRFLPLGDKIQKDKNDHSCVLLISQGARRILLTGDISARAERYLLQKFPKDLAKLEVLQVPHHGSSHSSGDKFVKHTSPVLGIISAGYRNRFGHPAEKVVKRYKLNGSRLLNTSQDGSITLLLEPRRQISVQTYQKGLF